MNGSMSFVKISNQITNRLYSDADIGKAIDSLEENIPETHTYKAIWDTGATHSMITPRVATKCSLKIVGITRLISATETIDSKIYFISLLLPNRVCIPNLKVVTGKLNPGIDMLIGMDVINQGDFAVNNLHGFTTFSFRIPSLECIDYTGNVDPNKPCFCGSGELLKDCHWKNKHKA